MKQLLADLNPFVGRWEKAPRFKVPFRQVWTDRLQDWVREVLWCHLVLRLFRYDIDQIACKCGSHGAPE